MGSAWNRRLGALARWVLLVPVLLMSLIPAGAMPGHAADGTITLDTLATPRATAALAELCEHLTATET